MNDFSGKFLLTLGVLIFASMLTKTEALSTTFNGKAISTIFEEHEIVNDVLPKAPEQALKLTYDGPLSVEFGNELTPTQVKLQPKLEWDAEADAFYTVIMTDPDAPSRAEPKVREFKHWIVGNIPGENIEQGDVLAAYVGSGPPQGTGLHRYVFLVYKQPGKIVFEEERVGNNSREGRPKFKAAEFAKKYWLGDPIAGNFYQAQFDDYVPTLHKQLSGN